MLDVSEREEGVVPLHLPCSDLELVPRCDPSTYGLTCTFIASYYSTRLSWAHISVINSRLVVLVITLLEVIEKEEGVVAYPLGL